MTTVIKMTTFSVEIHDYCTIDDRDDKTHEEDSCHHDNDYACCIYDEFYSNYADDDEFLR